MTLTDTKIRKAKPAAKPYKLYDGHGLFLHVRPSGGKLWCYKYRFAGKEKQISFGPYPVVTLAMARERHMEARQGLASGVDPAEHKQEKTAQKAKTRQVGPQTDLHFTIRHDAATGDFILSAKNWREIFTAVDEAGFENFLKDRERRGEKIRNGSTHPGEVLNEEFLIPMKITKDQLADALHVRSKRISQIVRGDFSITPDIALRLSRYFGNSAEFWLNLQQMYDLAQARRESGEQIEREVAARPA